MEQFNNLNQTALVDLLAEYTAKYSKLRTEGGLKKEFDHCLLTIKYLTKIIESKKKEENPDSNDVISTPETIFFKE